MTFLHITKDIVDPEGQQNAQHAEGEHEEEVLPLGEGCYAQRGQRNGCDACRQTVETIDQIDGIGDVDDHKDRQRYAYPRWHLANPEQTGEVVNPKP